MPEITATDAARNFSDILDAIEHHGEHFTIVRRGRAIARLEPIGPRRGADVKEVLGRHHPDRAWLSDIEEVRHLLEPDFR